jgi:hypothetical protein
MRAMAVVDDGCSMPATVPTQRLVSAVDEVVLAVHAMAERRNFACEPGGLAALNCWLMFASGVSARDIACEMLLDVPVVIELINGADEARADSADVASWLEDLLALVVGRSVAGYRVSA